MHIITHVLSVPYR